MKFSLVRLFMIFFIVLLLPLVQKQWLNLDLFSNNNFTIYKVLYYLSGLIVPILVIINSLNNFTYYKFNVHEKNIKNISGKFLLLITIFLSTTLSILISHYIFINLKIFLNFFLSNNEYFVKFDLEKQILAVVIITTFLIFKKTKLFLKKIILTNYFIFSFITWYIQINNSFLIDVVPSYIFKFGNINFLNVILLLAIETVFYFWSYISYRSNLSDWRVPKLYIEEVSPILNIAMFYFLIILYYLIIF